MTLKQDNHIFTGLQQDIVVSKLTPNYLIDAKNIRLTAIDNLTLMSITNEKGPLAITDIKSGAYDADGDWQTGDTVSIEGIFIGSCTINNFYILFTNNASNTENPDNIYRIELATTDNTYPRITRLYLGNLHFNLDYPLETLASYENDSILKVYWTDNYNQPRVINIAPYMDSRKISDYKSSSFDFYPELSLLENITVTKNYDSGLFSAGVILWAFTYYNLYGQETAIFHTTPLYYITNYGRGGSPTDICNNSFTITVNNLDAKYDYLRAYSIHRTSLDATPVCRRVIDIPLVNNNTQTIITGETITYTLQPGSTESLTKTGISNLNINIFNYYSIDKISQDSLESSLVQTNYRQLPIEYKGYKLLLDTDDKSIKVPYTYLVSKDVSIKSTEKDTSESLEVYNTNKEGYNIISLNSNIVCTPNFVNTSKSSIKLKFKKDNSNYSITELQIQAYTDNLYTNKETIPLDGDSVTYTIQSDLDRIYLRNSNITSNDIYTATIKAGEDDSSDNNIYTKDINILESNKGKIQIYSIESDYTDIRGNYYIPVINGDVNDNKSAQIEITATENTFFLAGDTITFSIGYKDKHLYGLEQGGNPKYVIEVYNSEGTTLETQSGTFTDNVYMEIPLEISYKLKTNNACKISIILDLNNIDFVETGAFLEDTNIYVEYVSFSRTVTSDAVIYNIPLIDLSYNNIYNTLTSTNTTIPKTLGLITFDPKEECFNILLYDYCSKQTYDYYRTILLESDNSTNNTLFGISNTKNDTSNYTLLDINLEDEDTENPTTICKSIYIKNITRTTIEVAGSISFTDNGTLGSVVDPLELLYKGGLSFIAESLCLKDGTLFFGNITLLKPDILSIRELLLKEYRTTKPLITLDENTKWDLRDISYKEINTEFKFHLDSDNCAGFKYLEYYRFGLLFLYKTGEWSDPIWIGDSLNTVAPTDTLQAYFKYTLSNTDILTSIKELGYKKIRGVIALPFFKDRTRIAQGVTNPTLYRPCDRYGLPLDLTEEEYNKVTLDSSNGVIYSLSSWIFRPYKKDLDVLNISTTSNVWTDTINYGGSISCKHNTNLASIFQYPFKLGVNNSLGYCLRSTEIGGYLEYTGRFFIDYSMLTFNSPDILWDTSVLNYNFTGNTSYIVGTVKPQYNYGDEDLIMASSTMSDDGKGFIKRSFKTNGHSALITLLCYNDCIIDDTDDTGEYGIYTYEKPMLWPVYMWQANGSITNHPQVLTGTSLLKTKLISNYRYANTTIFNKTDSIKDIKISDILIFNSDTISILKTDSKVYRGNIDTTLNIASSPYFMSSPITYTFSNGIFTGSHIRTETSSDISYISNPNWILFKNGESLIDQWSAVEVYDSIKDTKHSLYLIDYNSTLYQWHLTSLSGDYGDDECGVSELHRPIRMKYKETPHALFRVDDSVTPGYNILIEDSLALIDITKDYNVNTLYGGTTEDALKLIIWIPAGPAIVLPTLTSDDTTVSIPFYYGDTFYLRWDCMKTYPWSSEDVNLLVDIMSFPVESRLNMDGRYDRNRGQHSNLNMSPTNYNLLNTVYSQLDNFFLYLILSEDYYNLNKFPNQITYSTQKNAGTEVDPWCNITLGSTFDLDGDKGLINSLKVWNDNIYCFLDKGISNVIFNPRALIPTSDGVAIEIGNNYKLEGKRYISDGTGCSNKYSILVTPSGIYFINSLNNDLYLIGEKGLVDVSLTKGLSTYFNTIDTSSWTPNTYGINNSEITFYDNVNNDVYITTSSNSLYFSEQLGEFVSFVSYEGLYDMFNIDHSFYCIKLYDIPVIYKMHSGDYNKFFHTNSSLTSDIYLDYYISFVSNGRSLEGDTSTLNKVFTNIEFRADKWDIFNSTLSNDPISNTKVVDDTKYSKQPFDYIRVWNEYQDTDKKDLTYERVKPSNLKEKFRIWRITIPRDKTKKRDRISNPWTKITLGINLDLKNPDTKYFNLHDLNTIFYI